MFEQSKRLSEPLRWTRAGRIAVVALGGFFLAGVVALAIVALTADSGARRGCIEYTFPSTLGGDIVHVCGSRAREQCSSPRSIPLPVATVADICRNAGLRVGS